MQVLPVKGHARKNTEVGGTESPQREFDLGRRLCGQIPVEKTQHEPDPNQVQSRASKRHRGVGGKKEMNEGCAGQHGLEPIQQGEKTATIHTFLKNWKDA